ncbi:developmentally-regulated GTP-binding protein 2 [Sarcoptes scabiei]|nr:developmentally-regulated GTP-binding protein 2 [Sarcoptes scabiei]
MSTHFQQIKTLKTILSHQDFVLDKQKGLSYILHSADISHPSKIFSLHQRWTLLLMEEFFRQGDMERELGLAYSPLCDRNSTLIPQSQIGFIEFIVHPTMELCGDLIERVYDHLNGATAASGGRSLGSEDALITKTMTKTLTTTTSSTTTNKKSQPHSSTNRSLIDSKVIIPSSTSSLSSLSPMNEDSRSNDEISSQRESTTTTTTTTTSTSTSTTVITTTAPVFNMMIDNKKLYRPWLSHLDLNKTSWQQRAAKAAEALANQTSKTQSES